MGMVGGMGDGRACVYVWDGWISEEVTVWVGAQPVCPCERACPQHTERPFLHVTTHTNTDTQTWEAGKGSMSSSIVANVRRLTASAVRAMGA